MGEKCKASYRNLNTIKSYSEQKYATVQWCEQNCENDEWLRQQVEQLKYLSPPAVRKRFDITKFVDGDRSYSCMGNGNHQVVFDNSTRDVRVFDFRDVDLQVDTSKTTADGINYTVKEVLDSNNNPVIGSDGLVVTEDTGEQQLRYQLPTDIDEVIHEPTYEAFGTATSKSSINSYWYVGWDKDIKYYVRPDWLKSWKDSEIKSVARGQTFKAECSGKLQSVDLALDWNGSKANDCGSPLYVQIWRTSKGYVGKSTWDRDKKQMVYKYIKYSSIPVADRWAYENQQRYEQYDKKLKYTSGKKKGQWIYVKDKNGKKVIKTEKRYRKKKNGEYVVQLELVYKLGHNKLNPKWGGKTDTKNKPWLTNIYFPLAEAVYEKVGEPFPNIQFKVPCNIKKGEHYAIVLFSPLSEWKHCPRWGGWGRNCYNDKKYSSGHAFTSKNNGRTWTIYGKNGADTDDKGKVLAYKKGKYTPQDFAFQCHVETSAYSETHDPYFVEGKYYLYLKPIYSNPIHTVTLNAIDKGSEESEEHIYIDYEISVDGDVWIPIANTGSVTLEEPSRVLLVRAILYRETGDDYKKLTPFIEKITVELQTNLPTEMYARTSFYKPITSPMLGANLWGRVFAPFSTEATVDCTAEIIQGNEVSKTIHIIEMNNLDEKMNEKITEEDNVYSLLNSLSQQYADLNDILNKEGEERAIALSNNYDFLQELKNHNIYIKPFLSEDNLRYYLLSFAYSSNASDMIISRSSVEDDFDYEKVASIDFKDNVAYPLLSVNGQPISLEEGASVDSYSELVDYTFDYENNKLYFKRRIIEDLVEEDLIISYNKVFIGGLTSDEVGHRIDEETGIKMDGLILDYFKEKILITNDHLVSRKVGLRVEPTDPIRQVYLYKYNADEGDEPKELFEDYDFSIDIDTNELIFEVSNTDGVSTILDEGDVLEVVYTPFLTDDSLAIGYYATRTNTDMQCKIENVYFEYKV